MKKLLLATLVAGLMSTSLMAVDGTVSFIKVDNVGVTTVAIEEATGTVTILPVLGGVEAIKTMVALALTAKSLNAPVTLNSGLYDGTLAWKTFKMK